MDENSRMGEAPQGEHNPVEDGTRNRDVPGSCNKNTYTLQGVLREQGIGTSGSQVTDQNTNTDVIEISPDTPPPKYEETESANNQVTMVETVTESNTARSPLPTYEEQGQLESSNRLTPDAQNLSETPRAVIGPPPSYSFVMKQKKKNPKTGSPENLLPVRTPPPTYGNVRGLILSPENTQIERICNLPVNDAHKFIEDTQSVIFYYKASLSEPIWRSHSQPALCPRCGILILTTTHTHDSVATHVAALALCLFGCWPCCLLPYCMSVCKNTYHHCPICQAFLGAYTPW